MVLFDPVKAVEDFKKKNGDKPVLNYALGLYYDDVLLRYRDQWLLSEEELVQKTIEYLQKAFDKSCYDGHSLSVLALAYYRSADLTNAEKIYKKKIEAGLIHRLDTPTCGLVLIAKTQKAFNAIHLMQERNLIEKTYFAFTEKSASQIPPVIESQFRAFGPKGRKTVPVFRSSKRFEPGKKTYHTKILEIKEAGTKSAVTCSLTQGFRHQVRTHLASAGMPICGDALYSPFFGADFPNTVQKDIIRHLYPLQLYAVGITFPDLSWTNVNRKNINDKKSAATITASKETSSHSKISFWLPPPDKMIR